MDCRRAEELLERYHDGELGHRLAAQLRVHLEAECKCSEALAELHRLRALLANEVHAEVDRADYSRLWANVRRGIAAQRRPGLVERLRVFFGELLAHRAPALAAVGAAALALMVAIPLLPSTGNGTDDGGDAIEIISLESDATVTVWPVTNDDGEVSTIIWISDATDDYEGSEEPGEPPLPDTGGFE